MYFFPGLIIPIKKEALRNFCVVVVVQLLSHVQLFATPWTAARQAPLSFTISQSLLKLKSIESVTPSNLSHPLLPSSLRAFSLSQHIMNIPGEGNGTPLQYSCLENPMDGGAW